MSAFDNTVEVSKEAKSKGLGTRLYLQLFSSLRSQGIRTVLSGIALPNDASVALHKKFGFREVGIFKDYAMKNGEYISSMWLEKLLSEQGNVAF